MSSSSIISFGLIFAACASSAFALSFDKLELSSLIGGSNFLFVLGVLILGLAGYMYLSCACCGSSCSIGKNGKKMKKHTTTTRAASADSKRNSSTSSIRKSPRKTKASF